jgi:hypothetical protein
MRGADRVRFEWRKTAKGLYRHRIVRYVFRVPSPRDFSKR